MPTRDGGHAGRRGAVPGLGAAVGAAPDDRRPLAAGLRRRRHAGAAGRSAAAPTTWSTPAAAPTTRLPVNANEAEARRAAPLRADGPHPRTARPRQPLATPSTRTRSTCADPEYRVTPRPAPGRRRSRPTRLTAAYAAAGSPRWDEMVDTAGAVRDPWREVGAVAATCSASAACTERKREGRRAARRRRRHLPVPRRTGVEQPWALDPVPLLVDEAEWAAPRGRRWSSAPSCST